MGGGVRSNATRISLHCICTIVVSLTLVVILTIALSSVPAYRCLAYNGFVEGLFLHKRTRENLNDGTRIQELQTGSCTSVLNGVHAGGWFQKTAAYVCDIFNSRLPLSLERQLQDILNHLERKWHVSLNWKRFKVLAFPIVLDRFIQSTYVLVRMPFRKQKMILHHACPLDNHGNIVIVFSFDVSLRREFMLFLDSRFSFDTRPANHNTLVVNTISMFQCVYSDFVLLATPGLRVPDIEISWTFSLLVR